MLYTKTRETRTESDIRLIVRSFVPSFVPRLRWEHFRLVYLKSLALALSRMRHSYIHRLSTMVKLILFALPLFIGRQKGDHENRSLSFACAAFHGNTFIAVCRFLSSTGLGWFFFCTLHINTYIRYPPVGPNCQLSQSESRTATWSVLLINEFN